MFTQCGSFERIQTPEDAASQYIVLFLFHSPELQRATKEDAPLPTSSAVVPPGGEAAKQQSSASEYFSCFSSLSQIIRANEDGKGNTQVGSEHGWEVQLSCSAQALLFKSPLKNLKRASGQRH